MPGINGNEIETNDCYIGHNYSAPAMTTEELEELRGGATTQIICTFTSKDREASLAQTVSERGSASERDFSGRPLEGY